MCIDEWWVVALWCIIVFPGVYIPELWVIYTGVAVAVLYVISAWQILPEVRNDMHVLALD